MLYKILAKGTLMLGYHNTFELCDNRKQLRFYESYTIKELTGRDIDLHAKMDWGMLDPYLVSDVFLLTFWRNPHVFTVRLAGVFPVLKRDWAQGIKEFSTTKQGALKSAVGKSYRPDIRGQLDRGIQKQYSHGKTFTDERGVGFFLRSWDPFFLKDSPKNVCSVVSFPIGALDYIQECGSHAAKVIRI